MDDSTKALRGKRALVVGGSTGIGRGIADAWAAAGADVLVGSRGEPSGAGAGRLSWLRMDLTETDLSRRQLASAAAEPFHFVCYSAVHYGERRALFADVAEAEWRRQIEINLNGLWLTLSATLGGLRDVRPGLFLGVSSEVVFNAGPGRSGYAATKAAASCLLNSVAQEENPDQVRIVQVLPAGMVDSPGIRQRRPADFDYSSYMRGSDFADVATELAIRAGGEYHGDSLVVGRGGGWSSIRAGIPESQSRSVGT
jgi:NAD(P)-dependent dehydrogenase (short-subunit alcohol dehydrogenase family)